MRVIETPVYIFDPSELLRPEPKFAKKNVNQFRDYTINPKDSIQERVRLTYLDMHTNQTVDFVKSISPLLIMTGITRKIGRTGTVKYKNISIPSGVHCIQDKHKKWCNFNTFKSTMKDALIQLNELVDESDPDVDIPNIVHAFQTAERIRKDFPNEDWFHLTGLIHDAGKVMAFYDEPQWCVVGDTFVVGAEWAPSIVYRDCSFENNPDGRNTKYNTKYGMYTPNCGLDNLLMSWGHDEYLYRMLKHNKTKLPEHALKMIRFHSFYPWHTGDDYGHLMTENDQKDIKKWVLAFNQYDLYTKSADIPDIESLWPYYEDLIEKYIPGQLEW